MADFVEETVPPKKRQKLDVNEPAECYQDEPIIIEKSGKIRNAEDTDEKCSEADFSSHINPRIDSSESKNFSCETKETRKVNLTETGNYKGHRTEHEVGIFEYISTHKGFSGTLKQRYSDFVVHEMDLQGRTVHLSDTSLPPELIKERLESSVLLAEAIKKLEDLVNSEDKTVKLVVMEEDDKEKRTLVHREIREKFPSLGQCVCLWYKLNST